ncbi:hypothetical protein D9619_008850 [Psilocybe cf. subviscida]|uniref:NADP-dependent oxidoreductase domain-containing protein n=1 Tax=Psilocybe cf. subviscida TaxID=2480587 RepID=A0A8H5BAF7_9AGAR|nr:hypothetical protein D9619_008850 [Psilocybe cf. subviscida]
MSTGQKKSMPYVRLGKSGLKVSKIILGCMSYGSEKWQDWVIGDETEAIKHIKTAYDAGINTFDTANMYSNGASEVILGKAIKELKLPRDEIVVLTKVFFTVAKTPSGRIGGADPDTEGYVNQHGLSRKHIFESVKHSLERLQLDYVDVLQCHRFDYDTPIEETMQALHDVVQAGYSMPCKTTRSTTSSPRLSQCRTTTVSSTARKSSLMQRQMFGVGSIPWSPLARGILTRPFDQQKATTRGKTDAYQAIYSNAGREKVVGAVEKVAKAKGASMAQVSLAWVLAKEGVTAPIVGTTSLDNLTDLLGAVNITLTPEEIRELEDGYVIQAAAGHS